MEVLFVVLNKFYTVRVRFYLSSWKWAAVGYANAKQQSTEQSVTAAAAWRPPSTTITSSTTAAAAQHAPPSTTNHRTADTVHATGIEHISAILPVHFLRSSGLTDRYTVNIVNLTFLAVFCSSSLSWKMFEAVPSGIKYFCSRLSLTVFVLNTLVLLSITTILFIYNKHNLKH